MIHGKIFSLGGVLLVSLFLGGCEKMIAVGEIETYCQENGADYSDAGWCDAPYEIMQKRDSVLAANKKISGRMKCRK